MYKLFIALLFIFVIHSLTFAETDESSLPNYKLTSQKLYLTVNEAYRLKKNQPDKVLFVDVRTRAEIEYVGIPEIIDSFKGDNVESGPDAVKRNLNGWKNAGLPWNYKLDKEKMYFK